MKRYRFRLESVLRVRRVQEDVARGALAHANAAVTAAEAALVDARSWMEVLAAEPPPGDPAAWEGRRSIQLGAADEIDERIADVQGALDHRTARQVALAEARTRVRALERLDERRRAEHDIDNARQTERVVDDLVTSRFHPAERGERA